MAFAQRTAVVTPKGLIAAGELGVGDEVFDRNGWTTRVSQKSEPKNSNTVSFVTDSGHTFTVSVDHPVIMFPYGNAVTASNVGRNPQPSIPVVTKGLVDSEFWGSEKSRRQDIGEAIAGSTWKGLEGQLGVVYNADDYAVKSPVLVKAIAASGGVARSHRHPTRSAMIVTEDRPLVHRINRINVAPIQACVGIWTESGSLLVTAGMIPIISDRG